MSRQLRRQYSSVVHCADCIKARSKNKILVLRQNVFSQTFGITLLHPMAVCLYYVRVNICHQHDRHMYQPGFEPATSRLLSEYAIHYTTAAVRNTEVKNDSNLSHSIDFGGKW